MDQSCSVEQADAKEKQAKCKGIQPWLFCLPKRSITSAGAASFEDSFDGSFDDSFNEFDKLSLACQWE
jgi:hypothetical protein